LLANARIDDGPVPPELASAVQARTPKQVENALESILASRPTLVDDLGKLIEAGRNAAPSVGKLQNERSSTPHRRRQVATGTVLAVPVCRSGLVVAAWDVPCVIAIPYRTPRALTSN
jgi:hypothetical protein